MHCPTQRPHLTLKRDLDTFYLQFWNVYDISVIKSRRRSGLVFSDSSLTCLWNRAFWQRHNNIHLLQIKSLLLSHHHSVKFLRACSKQCRNNLHIDSTYLQTYTDDNVQYTPYTQCAIRHNYSYQYTLYTLCTHSTLSHIYIYRP